MFRFTIRQLEYLIAVAETQSVSLAAEKKGVSAPSISVAISHLEAELGVPLFIRRHAQGMNLTPQGQELTRHAHQVLEAARQMVEAANRISGMVKGDLTVGCLATFAQILLPMLRRAFTTDFPEVEFHQVEAHQLDLIAAIREARMDVALTYDLAIPTDLSFHGLVELPPFVMLAEDHPLAGHENLTLPDVAGLPMILLDLPHSVDYFMAFFDKAGLKPKIFERTRDMALAQSMVANGFGYSIANVRPRLSEAPDGRPLKFLPLVGGMNPIRMGLLHSPGARDLPTIKAFFALCQKLLPSFVEGSLSVLSQKRS